VDKIQIIEPLGLSVNATAEVTGESTWQVYKKIRDGTYRARKAGARTLVDFQSIKAAYNNLPDWGDNTKLNTDKAWAAALAAIAEKRAAQKEQKEAKRRERKEAKRRTEQANVP
jgi:hypothetical protein